MFSCMGSYIFIILLVRKDFDFFYLEVYYLK